MSQTETGKATTADERTEAARSFVRTVKAATRRKYTPEEKIRIVLEGFRREVTVSDLCRREGIKPHSYYSRGMVGIKHILATPFHPQTNGKLERYHQTLKRDVNQLPYEMPSDLEAAIVAFVSYYNYRRYHKALSKVTPSDVLKGRREEILRRRKEVQTQTVERRRRHNRIQRELTTPRSEIRSLGANTVPLLLVANTHQFT